MKKTPSTRRYKDYRLNYFRWDRQKIMESLFGRKTKKTVSEGKKPASIQALHSIFPGGFHGRFYSNVGIIRKPFDADTINMEVR